jgi:hypothetical protein
MDTSHVPFRCVANIVNVIKFKGCSDFSQWNKLTVCKSIHFASFLFWCSSEDKRAAALINQQLPGQEEAGPVHNSLI